MNILFFLVPKNEVVYVYEDNTLEQAMEVMEKHRFSSVPVLSRSGGYVGSLTEGDILWGLKERAGSDALLVARQIQVRQMNRLRDNQPVNINCNMEELIEASMRQNFIPVVDDHQIFIGIVTRRSVISYYMKKEEGLEELK